LQKGFFVAERGFFGFFVAKRGFFVAERELRDSEMWIEWRRF